MFRPNLAATWEGQPLRFPVLASPKIDGIRCIIFDGVAYSRSMKPIRNKFVQEYFADGEFDGYDGELAVGEPNAKDLMQKTTSGVMSFEGEPDFHFHVFDFINSDAGYRNRTNHLIGGERVSILEQVEIKNLKELEEFEAVCLAIGYEGVMIRDPNGKYKEGRSTVREGGLLKVKRFADAEALVIGVIEQMHNANEAEVSETGYTKRSQAQAGLVPNGVLGALLARDLATGVAFSIGSGFTYTQRQAFWQDPPIGKIVTYRHFPQAGVKDKPRFPTFHSFRDSNDLS